MASRLPPSEQLDEANRRLLVSNIAFLQENLELSTLLPYMTAVLNDEDFAAIRSFPTTSEQVEKLVTILPERGDEAFDCFITNLRISQPHLADDMFKNRNIGKKMLPRGEFSTFHKGEQSKQQTGRAREQAEQPNQRKEKQSKQQSEREREQSEQPKERKGEQFDQPSERERGQSKHPIERERRHSKQLSERERGQSKQANERERGQPNQPSEPREQIRQPSERERGQSKQPSKRERGHSKQANERERGQSKRQSELSEEQSEQPSEHKGEQPEQPSEREPEQSNKTNKRKGEHSERPNKRQGEQSEQPSEWEGENSKHPSEQKTLDDVCRLLLAEVTEWVERGNEQDKQPSKEKLKKTLEEYKQMLEKADVAKLAPSNLPLPVKMAVLKQSTAAKDNQNRGKLIGMKFDHVFAAIHTQEETQKTILFTETIKGEGFRWDCRERGVCIKFSPKAVPEPKMITCSLWRPSAVSLPNEADESLVSSVIQLACDDTVGVNFSGITVVLSHSAVDMGGYELVMKELTDPENDTWKNLNTTNVTWDPSGPLLESTEWQSDLRFVQATITNFSLYAVICRLKSYKFSFDASMKRPELTCQVPSPISECSDVRVTIPRKSLSKEEVELTMKVQEVPNGDYEEKKAFVGPILHISCPVVVQLKEPASIKIPVASQQDLQKLQSLSISNVRICNRSTQDSSQEWVDITEDLRPPPKLENGTVTFQVNHFSLFTAILVPVVFEEAGILELLKLDSSAPQQAGFLACLCSTGNPVEHLLVLCCYPLHMANEVWKSVSSTYTVGRHGQDTSRHSLNREDKVSFSLPDELSPCEQIDMETQFLRFPGNKSFQTSFKVHAKKIESAPEITFFKQNGLEKALCTLVIVPVSAPQHDCPWTSQGMPGDQGSIGELEMRKELLTADHILKIKVDIGTCWYDLGIALRIEPAKLNNLEQDCQKVEERAKQVLEIWAEKNGGEATVGRLAWALITIEHRRIADKLLAISKSTQPSEQEDEQSKFPSEQGSKQSKQQSERKGEQIKQPNEPEAPDEIFSLLAEVQQMRKEVTGLESQPKEYSGEQAKQPTGCEGGQSKQQCEQETADDMFSLLADIQKLTKTVIEHKRQRTEDETLKKMIEDIKQMNLQVQQLIKKNNSERKL